MRIGSGVVARVSVVTMVSPLLLLLLLLLLLSLVLLLLFLPRRRCLWGRFQGARLVGKWVISSWPVPLSFYPPAGASHDISLSIVGHRHYPQVPRCCRFQGTLST